MNISELTDQVATGNGLTRVQAKRAIDSIFRAIVDSAAKGEEVALPGFGKFKVASRPEREGRNPATGETIKIAASKRLTFAPAKGVKDAINS
ncbi:HU family DNA-binding protein [Inquilinus sp. Marseille-Q2685]|uniref:HU family DNA-binding protein n=1 Tax=Inquilinus sp. Marseille-Q2685 TaxID=2866581 RepID=UPI001CE4633B|nr:HU family DNA-binding protein [Inquilinus sp. Marseille-Q2685]